MCTHTAHTYTQTRTHTHAGMCIHTCIYIHTQHMHNANSCKHTHKYTHNKHMHTYVHTHVHTHSPSVPQLAATVAEQGLRVRVSALPRVGKGSDNGLTAHIQLEDVNPRKVLTRSPSCECHRVSAMSIACLSVILPPPATLPTATKCPQATILPADHAPLFLSYDSHTIALTISAHHRNAHESPVFIYSRAVRLSPCPSVDYLGAPLGPPARHPDPLSVSLGPLSRVLPRRKRGLTRHTPAVRLRCCGCRVSFFYLRVVIPSSAEGHLGCFHFPAL